MRIQFNLHYRTSFGEQLVLNVLTDSGALQQHRMGTTDGVHWTCELSKAVRTAPYMDYYYSLMRDVREVRQEWTTIPHRLEFAAKRGTVYRVYDYWRDIPDDAYRYSSAFTECIDPRKRQFSDTTAFARTLRLKVRAPQLYGGQRLAMTGSGQRLGNWDLAQALPMAEHECHEWVVSLDADTLPETLEFKFVALPCKGDAKPVWETGMNRLLTPAAMEANEVLVYELSQAEFPTYPWKAAGTVVPVFSLRSEGSYGVGDFGDLKMMVDWCALTYQRVLQLLPVNDTTITHTWQDSYPYNAISIYALHPQFADFRQLPPLADDGRREHYEKLRCQLNALPQIDYERMMEAKMAYLRELFRQEWSAVRRRTSYKEFYEHNKEWLEPYARFCVQRDRGRTDDHVTFWYFVQYVLDSQMHSAHEHARRQHVVLKGDIPIGISRDGVEARVEPRYFNLDGQAGAPPDAFSDDGQNWGFPTYNWDEMMKDGCSWWVRRFRKMAEYFDAYRIDHVLGFFRIWEIPMPEKSGLLGQFQPALAFSREEIAAYGVTFRDDLFLIDHKRADRWHPRIAVQFQPAYEQLSDDQKVAFNRLYDDFFYRRNNQYWYQEAMKKLPRLTQATRMLVCAEDLGMVPDCVPWVMNELRILSLEIQSMPKSPNTRFGHLSQNPYRSVCTISTHDMSTLRQWWDEDPERTQDYYNTMLYRSGEAPHPLPGWLARDIISRHLTSPSMLCLLSLQDWLSMDERLRLPDQNAERINIPANPRHYWRYRMHLTIEQLMAADSFNDELRTLIAHSGRK